MIKYLTNWKYRHFKNKLRGVEKMMEDLTFKKFKTLEIREQIRQQYDGEKAKLAVIEEALKKENPEARLQDDKALLERDAERHLNQMKQLDLEAFGSKPTQELQNGFDGIDQQLDSLGELKLMIKEYVRIL